MPDENPYDRVVSRNPQTVRRPARPNTGIVRQALDRLETMGMVWAPRFVDLDQGDEVLSWLPGETIDDWWHRPDLLDELTRIVRQLHDATADLAPGFECLIHDDLQPRNIVVARDRLGVIDWEQLRPGRRIEDVAQLCWSFAAGPTDRDVVAVGRRWRRVADLYGLDGRDDLVSASLAKISRCIGHIVDQAAGGSDRHRRLRARGDHHDLASLHHWIEAHRGRLLDFVT